MRKSGAFLALATCLLAGAPAMADTVMLRNGDRLKGKIIENDGRRVVFDSQRYGRQVIDSAEIRELVDESVPKVEVEDPVEVPIFREGWRGSASHPGLSTINEIEPRPAAGEEVSLLDHWNHKLVFGFMSQSAQITSSSLRAEYEGRWRGHEDELRLRMDISRASQIEPDGRRIITGDRLSGETRFRHDFDPTYFGDITARYLHDRAQGIDWRVQQFIGLGYRYLETETFRGALIAGPMMRTDRYLDNDYTNSRSKPFFFISEELAWVIDEGIVLRHEFSLQRAVQRERRLTLEGGVEVEFLVRRWLAFSVRAALNWDVDPNAGIDRFQTFVSAGVGIRF